MQAVYTRSESANLTHPCAVFYCRLLMMLRRMKLQMPQRLKLRLSSMDMQLLVASLSQDYGHDVRIFQEMVICGLYPASPGLPTAATAQQ